MEGYGNTRKMINARQVIVYIIFKALAKVVTTKGSESQNQGLKDGRASIVIITIAETKK